MRETISGDRLETLLFPPESPRGLTHSSENKAFQVYTGRGWTQVESCSQDSQDLGCNIK